MAAEDPTTAAPEYALFNRDLSWLNFNFRVLNEALDPRTPLLERLKFVDIFRSNNDEFFMKRIGPLLKRIEFAKSPEERDRLEKLHFAIRSNHIGQIETLSASFRDSIAPALDDAGIGLPAWSDLKKDERKTLFRHFRENVFPLLTPLAVDEGHPFPFLSNLSKSVGVKMERKKRSYFARVKIPEEIPQWFPLKGDGRFRHRFISIDEIVLANISELFPGMDVGAQTLFRVTRDATVEEDSEDTDDKMEWVEEGLKERKFAPVVRLELLPGSDPWIPDLLSQVLDLTPEQIYSMPTPSRHPSMEMLQKIDLPELKYKRFVPSPFHNFEESLDPEKTIFDHIRRRDHLVHFPYESFSSTVEAFVQTAAEDPKVMGIKIILYRTDTGGELVDTLIRAAENKKQVACVIELTARFDEERNILWAQKLEEAGVHVSYGMMEYKTHAKIIVVVREDPDGLRTYVNIGTGNYNSQTSNFYTDFSLFTCRKKTASEILELFNYLTGRSLKKKYPTLLVAPFNMSRRFRELIREETELAREGRGGRIIAKMNQLKDPKIINALYEAGQAGVEVTLIVRGVLLHPPGGQGALGEHRGPVHRGPPSGARAGVLFRRGGQAPGGRPFFHRERRLAREEPERPGRGRRPGGAGGPEAQAVGLFRPLPQGQPPPLGAEERRELRPAPRQGLQGGQLPEDPDEEPLRNLRPRKSV